MVRLQGKFEIDHSREWNGKGTKVLRAGGGWPCPYQKKSPGTEGIFFAAHKVSGEGPTLPSLRPKVWVGAGLGSELGLREGRVGPSPETWVLGLIHTGEGKGALKYSLQIHVGSNSSWNDPVLISLVTTGSQVLHTVWCTFLMRPQGKFDKRVNGRLVNTRCTLIKNRHPAATDQYACLQIPYFSPGVQTCFRLLLLSEHGCGDLYLDPANRFAQLWHLPSPPCCSSIWPCEAGIWPALMTPSSEARDPRSSNAE